MADVSLTAAFSTVPAAEAEELATKLLANGTLAAAISWSHASRNIQHHAVSTTSLLVLHDLQTVYTRDQGFGGKQLTEDIMRFYGMSYEEAGKAKRLGNLPPNYENEVLSHFIADMAQQIDRSLQFFFAAASRHNVIDQVILAGGCAHIPGVEAAIHQRLQIPCVIAQPFAKMSIGSRAKPAQLGQDQASMLIAAGLALRAFDLDN